MWSDERRMSGWHPKEFQYIRDQKRKWMEPIKRAVREAGEKLKDGSTKGESFRKEGIVNNAKCCEEKA